MGNSSIIRTDDVNNIGNLNPFRWKSHYYDNETGMYYINGRYYEDEIGQFITPDYSSINPLIIGGLNAYGLGVSDPLMFGVNGYNFFTPLPLVFDEWCSNYGLFGGMSNYFFTCCNR